jgi:hypothetical protein
MVGAFKNLENTLLETQGADGAIAVLASLKKLEKMRDMEGKPANYHDMIRYFLAVENEFRQMPLDVSPSTGARLPHHAYVGGYGVLAHLIAQFGPDAIPAWRTSHDLDIAVWNPHLDTILRRCFEGTKRHSHIHKDKRSYEIKDPDAEIPCDVDFYLPSKGGAVVINTYMLGDNPRHRARSVDVFGIPVWVVDWDDLLRLKLNVGTRVPRAKDVRDVSDLLSLYATRGDSAEMFAGWNSPRLFPNEQQTLATILRTQCDDGNRLSLTIQDEDVGERTRRFAQQFLKQYDFTDPYKQR